MSNNPNPAVNVLYTPVSRSLRKIPKELNWTHPPPYTTIIYILYKQTNVYTTF